jgi:hypothetical protein
MYTVTFTTTMAFDLGTLEHQSYRLAHVADYFMQEMAVPVRGVVFIGAREGFLGRTASLPQYKVTVDESYIDTVAKFFNRSLTEFEVDFNAEWESCT